MRLFVYTKQSLHPDSSEAVCLYQTITASRQLWGCFLHGTLTTPNNHCIQTVLRLFVYTKQSLHPDSSEAVCLHQTITASRQLWGCFLHGTLTTPNNHCIQTVLRFFAYTKTITASRQLWDCLCILNNHCIQTALKLLVYTKQSLHSDSSEVACLHQSQHPDSSEAAYLHQTITATRQLWGCLSTPNTHCIETDLMLLVNTKQSLHTDSSEAVCLHQTITAAR